MFYNGLKQRKVYHPSGLFDDWGNGARRLLTVEKEEAQLLLWLTCLYNYIADKTNKGPQGIQHRCLT